MKDKILLRENKEKAEKKLVYSLFDQDDSMLEEIKNILKEIRER